MTDQAAPKKARRPAGSRAHPVKSDLASAFDAGRSDVVALPSEIEEWHSNMESNNMENLPKFEEVTECKDVLEGPKDALENLEPPDCLGEVAVSYFIDTRRSAQSRSARLSNALSALEAALGGAEEWLEENPELEEGDDEDGDVITEDDVSARETERQEVEEFVSEMENAVSELHSVDFPGMY